MPFGSRNKGNSAEREVAALLQEWWRRIEPDCHYIRAPLSGGWSSADVRAHFRAAGDLMTTAARWPYCVEVKRREGWVPSRLLAGKASPAWEWWREAVEEARVEKATPMLWLRRNREPWMVLLPELALLDCHLTPDAMWSAPALALAGVDYAGVLPAMWFATRVLRLSPRPLARPRGVGARAPRPRAIIPPCQTTTPPPPDPDPPPTT